MSNFQERIQKRLHLEILSINYGRNSNNEQLFEVCLVLPNHKIATLNVMLSPQLAPGTDFFGQEAEDIVCEKIGRYILKQDEPKPTTTIHPFYVVCEEGMERPLVWHSVPPPADPKKPRRIYKIEVPLPDVTFVDGVIRIPANEVLPVQSV